MKNISKDIEKIEQGDAWEENDTVVGLTFKKPLDKVIPIRLQAEHWQRLKLEANELGVGPTTLARMWIIERLRKNDLVQQERLISILHNSLIEEMYPNLNQTECKILNLITQDFTSKQIAEALNMSTTTLQNEILEMLNKLKEKTRDNDYPIEKNRTNKNK